MRLLNKERPLNKVWPGELVDNSGSDKTILAVALHEPPSKQRLLCHADGFAFLAASAAAVAAAVSVHVATWQWLQGIQAWN